MQQRRIRMTRLERPIAVRRAERELFFWTARQSLRLIWLVTATVYLVASLIEGRLPGTEVFVRMVSQL